MRLSVEYLAGFFDGEGSVGIYAGGGTGRTLRAQVTQSVTPEATQVLQALRSEYGGSLSRMHKSMRREAWCYQVGGTGAARLLRAIEPHLILKADQVSLALLWFESRPARERDAATGRHLARADEDRALTERVADLLRRMKRESVMPDAADLVEVRHVLRQIVNVKGD